MNRIHNCFSSQCSEWNWNFMLFRGVQKYDWLVQCGKHSLKPFAMNCVKGPTHSNPPNRFSFLCPWSRNEHGYWKNPALFALLNFVDFGHNNQINKRTLTAAVLRRSMLILTQHCQFKHVTTMYQNHDIQVLLLSHTPLYGCHDPQSSLWPRI